MPNNFYLPSAIQESGVDSTAIPSAGVQPPVPSAFDFNPPLTLRRVAVTATTFRAAFGCMWAAEGDVGNINTANYFLNLTRAWKTRTITGHVLIGAPGELSVSSGEDQDSVYFPSVSASPQDSSPGAGDGWYAYGYMTFGDYNNDLGFYANAFAGSSGEATDYLGVNRTDYWTSQAVDSGAFTSAPASPTYVTTWSQGLTNEDSAADCVTDLKTFLLGLNMTALWGPSPPVIYHDYFKNIYWASCGDYADPSYVNLSSTYTDFNTDITNLAADRASGDNYAYDGVFYPIPNLGPDEVLPGAYGTGLDVGFIQGFSSFGIIGDLSRCHVGFVGANASPNPSAAGGSATPLCDRVQYMSGTMLRVTMFEQGYYTDDGSTTKVLLKPLGTQVLMPGVVFEIPQPSFTEPFISSQGGGIGDVCVFSMDVVVVFNSTIEAYATAYGVGAHITSAW